MSIFMHHPTHSPIHREPIKWQAPYLGHQHQKGVALFMVLMVTLVIVALSVSLATGVFSEYKTSRNTADLAIARQAAEAALRDAEQDVNCMAWDVNTKTFKFNTSISTNGSTANVREYCAQAPKLCTQIGDAGVTATCANGMVLKPLSASGDMPNATNIKDANCTVAFGGVTGQPKLATIPDANQPRYMIEVFRDPSMSGRGQMPVFRMLARGYGRDMSTSVDLESIYRPCDK
jgi:type IV pilus assembly protein PilX